MFVLTVDDNSLIGPGKTASPSVTRLGRFSVTGLISATPLMETLLVHDGPEPRVLRLLARWVSEDASYRALFERLAPSMVTLEHPHLTDISELGIIDDRLYVLSEYIPAPSLRTMNRTLSARAGITAASLRRGTRQMLSALSAVHTLHDSEGEPAYLLYRDPLPGHMFFRRGTGVVLRDPIPWPMHWLNQVRFVLRDRSTDAFRSPQELACEDLGPTSDIYTLCNSMLILLNPVALHVTTPRVERHLREARELLRAQDPALSEVFERALHSDPAQRFTSAQEMYDEIRPLSDDERAASDLEIQQFLQETRSATRKNPEELSSSLQAIRRAQQPSIKVAAPQSRPPDEVLQRRTETIDLPLDALPDLKARRDLARAKSQALKTPPDTDDSFDAPPPVGAFDAPPAAEAAPSSHAAIGDPSDD